MSKLRVLLTGASGSMGGATFQELRSRKDKVHVVLLLLPGPRERRLFRDFEHDPDVTIVWGDLTNPTDVRRAVDGCEVVLHPAALIAPAADKCPRQTRAVNVGGVQNIIEAIRAQPNGGDGVRLVSVGSVAEYGDRLPPIHMLKVGDPLKPSVGDFYATTKMAGERAVIESGLKRWVSLRQTFIALPNVLSLWDPIAFHQPPETHFEFITRRDAGLVLARTLDCPDDFWCRVYNISGGAGCRTTYVEFLERSFAIFGMDFRQIMPRRWFGLRNFHCGWYADSDVLERYTHHQRDSFEDYLEQVKRAAPAIVRWGGALGGKLPGVHAAVRRFKMQPDADPLHWVERGEEEKVKAFFGSKAAWEAIGGWESYRTPTPSTERAVAPYEGDDLTELARSRGGQVVSGGADPTVRARWRCAQGHEFDGTARLVRAGHWCPECVPPPWKWDDLARGDPLLASVWYNNHSRDERQTVDWLYCPNE